MSSRSRSTPACTRRSASSSKRPLVDEVAADDAVLRILPVADEGPDAVDHPLRLFGLLLPVRQCPQALQHAPAPSSHASCRPCSKRRSPAPGSKFLTLPRISGTSAVGRSLQRGRVMSISPTQRMPYRSRKAPDGVPRLRPARELGQLVQEAVVLDVLQERHDLRMRADRVRDVQQRQPHLRRDVVGDGLRQRVGRVLLAQPLLQLLVEPPRGLHRRP